VLVANPNQKPSTLAEMIEAAKAAPKAVDRYAVRADEKVAWHDVRDTDLEGRAFPEAERKSYFDRLPAEADGKVTPAVWGLSRDSAGQMFRFRTDATSIYAHYKVTKAKLELPHMPATGVSGLDLYARDKDGKWRWVQVVRPTAQEMKVRIAENLDPGEREYALYLPLYNGIESLEIGVPAGANIANQVVASKPGTVSATVGTSGAAGDRLAVVWASARILPSLAIGNADGMLSNITCMLPPIRSGMANWRPLYGMCVMLVPVIDLKSSPDTCTEVPTPGEPKDSLFGFAFM